MLNHQAFIKIGLAGILCLCLMMAGCQKPKNPDSSSETSETVIELKPKLDISRLLKASEVSELLKEEMIEPQVGENGSLLMIQNAEYTTTVQLSVEESTEEEFDSKTEAYTNLVEAPNIGKKALWSAEYSELLVLTDKYAVSVVLQVEEQSAERRLIYARYLAALALERL